MKSAALAGKPHYAILDGLRGVAALMVVVFHFLEAHATSHLDLMINHGYLAVDFFFLLSGFVIGYAYDDRWGRITLKEFFVRRLVRLQPMVVVGMVIGAVCFYFQESTLWPQLHTVPVWQVLVIMVIGFTVLPVPPSADIRGWMEMHPLNGPAWSLFFEYVGNLLYALGIRRLSNTALAVLVVLSGIALVHLAVTAGDVIGGWSLTAEQLHVGFVRLMFPFFAGLLLSRTVALRPVKNAFLLCSLMVIVALSIPRIGGTERLWLNGLYDAGTIIVVFPLIIYVGASGNVTSTAGKRVCKFLGDISYPVYITHYPIIYIYTGWVYDHTYSVYETAFVIAGAFTGCVLLAYLCLKFYDEPVRRWLGKRLLT